MDHRIADLPIEKAWRRKLESLRHREIYRQGLAIVLMLVYAVIATPPALLSVIGAILVVLGAVIRFWAAGVVMKNEELATSGPYAYVRHPLYAGNILALSGMSLVSGIWWVWLVSLLFFWFFYPAAIRYEDSKLDRLFGEPWRAWRDEVSALLPRTTPYSAPNAAAESVWSLTRAAGRNGEAGIFVYILACLVIALYW